MDSIFLDALKVFMELDENDAEFNALLNTSLNGAVAFVSRYCNINITYSTQDIILSGNNTNELSLNLYPIVSINTITIDGVSQSLDDYYISRSNIISTGSVFTQGTRNINVNATIGYETLDDVPADLTLAILRIAEKTFTDATENRDGVKGYSTSNKVSEDFIQRDLPMGVERMLALHKRYVI